MIVLALDTAGTGCFAALYDSTENRILGSAGADIGRGHAEQLMAFIDEALVASGKALSDVERVAVTIGPGSFTGIRVGVAAARGFALALAVPAVGVSRLAALAAAARERNPGQSVAVVMDAKRDEVYCQMFSADLGALTPPEALEVSEAVARLTGFDGIICGSGAVLVGGEANGSDLTDICVVARLGAVADPSQGKPKPLYLRGPDVKPQAGFAVSRA
ncbi:tRNA threonylcarbamoyl adenosine modification protein YeaZ [Pararhizobium capsulatum DSM 1112]|uniref:N(6)-L-threonylcarbamoyladenine synthase n=1 Tax=Pararhizobium capsulatum DSM 1112 TaxID=1121113 RepID=A0ABU0BKF5_9HYPH|nr:tRNA (adenosine(37)-N6)-threonylcarbamoyltransferase complex dimerization subunit type 1 TsaB [Pararhizobium capsulatum]MDQ0318723.1 tRNA threonylcarbamoyl adenosine modification protein YeaZ [Pararhizobium capsulatum DSM 1112]